MKPQDRDLYLELVDDVISMQQFVAEVAEGVSIADVIQREHVEWPVIDVLPQNVFQLRFISCFYGVSKWVYYTDLQQLYSWIDQYITIS